MSEVEMQNPHVFDQPNRDVAEFLEYYCGRAESPQYAVLVKGKWGAGKTWFVKDVLSKLEGKGIGNFFISLNGMNAVGAIDQELFRQAHPILGSRGMALAGRIATGALKAGLKIDLNGDGTDDGTLSIQIPSVEIPKKLKDFDGLVLVFDDLERCAIPISELLGYLNFFVEHSGHKMILLANEEELIGEIADEDEESPGTRDQISYLRIKEKLIGKTFQIEPETSQAIAAFVAALADTKARESIEGAIDAISSVFRSSKYENLRHVRQALLDLERLFSRLPSDILRSQQLIQEFVVQFLAITFEIRSGRIKSSDIKRVFQTLYVGADKDGRKSLFVEMSEKYAEADFQVELIPSEMWTDFVDRGRIDLPAIEQALRRTKFLAMNEQPAWVKLWHAYDLSDDQVAILLKEVSEEFETTWLDREEIVLHIAGILLTLSKFGIYQCSPSRIVIRAREQIDALRKSNKLNVEPDPFEATGYGGLGYHQRESEEFEEMLAYLKESSRRAAEEALPAEAAEVLRTMRNDSALFYRRVTLSNSIDQRYYEIPVLKHIDANEFVDTLASLGGDDLRRISLAIKRRYEFAEINTRLASESAWLAEVGEALNARAKMHPNSMTGRRLSDLEEAVNKAHASLVSAAIRD